MSWPGLFVELVMRGESYLEETVQLHFQVSTRIIGHSKGGFEHIERTQWLCMSLLCTDAEHVQTHARKLRHHLLRLKSSPIKYLKLVLLAADI